MAELLALADFKHTDCPVHPKLSPDEVAAKFQAAVDGIELRGCAGCAFCTEALIRGLARDLGVALRPSDPDLIELRRRFEDLIADLDQYGPTVLAQVGLDYGEDDDGRDIMMLDRDVKIIE